MRYASADAFVGLVLFNRFLDPLGPGGPVEIVDPTIVPVDTPTSAETGDDKTTITPIRFGV